MLVLIVFIAMEWALVGTAALMKARGEKHWYLAFIPFYGFFRMQRLTGEFRMLTIPVKKYGVMMTELFAVILLAWLFGEWGNAHLPAMSRESLEQILYLPYGVCIALIWAGQLKAAMKLFRMMRVEHYALYSLATALVVTAPIALVLCRKREIDYSISY